MGLNPCSATHCVWPQKMTFTSLSVKFFLCKMRITDMWALNRVTEKKHGTHSLSEWLFNRVSINYWWFSC